VCRTRHSRPPLSVLELSILGDRDPRQAGYSGETEPSLCTITTEAE
jgi:hypothetical protein